MNSQIRFNLFVACVSFVLCVPLGISKCCAWSLEPTPVEGIVLLKNSNILRGRIQKVGKHYHVHLHNGKLQIRAQQVETVCQNIEAAYQYRREQRGGSSADSHLDLAAWCLRHELYDRADAEIEEAGSIDADHPRLDRLRRQSAQSRKLAERAATRASTQPRHPVVTPVEPAEIEKAPKWARALFVRQVQPLVVQSCATGGCHEAGGQNEFQLNRLALDGPGHPNLTLRNLAETLKRIDFEDPANSDLLERARVAHGEATVRQVLPPHKLQVLNSWVEQLAEAHRQDNDLRTVPAIAEVDLTRPTPSLELNSPRQNLTSGATTSKDSAVRVASYAPRDPFDPAAFNDRYGTKLLNEAKQQISAGSKEELAGPELLEPVESEPIPLPAVE